LGSPQWDSDDPREFAWLMLTTVGITTLVWIVVTLITPPEAPATLAAFYRRTRPPGPGWRRVAAALPDVPPSDERLATQFANWIMGCTLIYAALFGVGHIVFGRWAWGAGLLLLAVVMGAVISRNLSRSLWQAPQGEVPANV
jgi:SSS family solute:Na+ symporter